MSENRGDVLTAFLLGGIIGVAIGILFAPASGRVTRERINDWLKETTEDAKQAIEKLEERLKREKEQKA